MKDIIINVLEKSLGEIITDVSYETTDLQGGTLGDVKLVFGQAKTQGGGTVPFRVVRKNQKKWERNFDPNSWRREYDLYESGIDKLTDNSLRRPKCYYAKLSENEVELWLEYIEGVSGGDLTGEMYELSSRELGRLQGRLYAQNTPELKSIKNLSTADFTKKNYLHYRSWNEVYDYIRGESCEIPRHLCEMLIDIDERWEDIWEQIQKLPLVLCHRDFWITNIFYSQGEIRLIDWDTTGWGYLGEDIASLIADEADVPHMIENFKRCVPAYYSGFSEYADVSGIKDNLIWEMMLINFGYRLVEWYKFGESKEGKALCLETLQQIYEMK